MSELMLKTNKVSSAKHGSQQEVYLSEVLFGDLWPHNCAGTMRSGIFCKFVLEHSS